MTTGQTTYQLFEQDSDTVIIKFTSDEYTARAIVDTYAKASNYEVVYELDESN